MLALLTLTQAALCSYKTCFLGPWIVSKVGDKVDQLGLYLCSIVWGISSKPCLSLIQINLEKAGMWGCDHALI